MATESEIFRDPFLGMLKQGTRSVADSLAAIGIALVVLGVIALVARWPVACCLTSCSAP